MSLQVLELNDHALVLGDAEGPQVVSPGFVLADDKDLVFGTEAQAQSRLHPNQSHSRFWQDLSLEPLAKGRLPNPRWRHLADLAHGHLNALAQQNGGEQTSTVLSVPGSFSQQQLGILVGIAKQTPLQVNGLVDSALLTAAALPVAKTSLVMQQQLHQTLFSLVELNAGQLRVVETQAVASTGSAQVLDALMHLSTDLFIEQCRFNPQHDAATEQLLYNALPQWLSSQPNGSTLQLDLNADGTAYTAKLTSDSLIAALAPIRSRLLEQLAALRQRAPEAELIACPTLAALPGLHDALRSLGSLSIVAVEQSLAVAHKVSDQLTSGEGLSLHRALNVEALDTLGSAVAPDNESAKARESFTTATLHAEGGEAAQLLKQLRLDGKPLNSVGTGAVRVGLGDGHRLVIRAADSSELTIELSSKHAAASQRGSDGQE
jgi:hypothetical protein